MSGPHPGDISNADDLLRRLGLDPDMTVIELQRRLAIANRVIAWHEQDVPVPAPIPFDGDDIGSRVFNEGIDCAAHHFLSTPENSETPT